MSQLTLEQIQSISLSLGKKSDPRARRGIDAWLKEQKKHFKKLSSSQKKIFDKERLTNPYMDSRIIFDNKRKVNKVLAGIDITGAELLLAKRLGINCVISHHPTGKALAHLDEVMLLQADLLHATARLPINIAEAIINKQAEVISRSIAPLNHQQTPDIARLLNISLLTAHTVADNQVWRFVHDLLSKRQPRYLGDILDILMEIPEYREARLRGEGPRIFVGKETARAGQIVASEFTGGTEPGKELYQHLARSGVGTIVGMHMSEKSRAQAQKHHINVIIAGHISSDSLGMNLFLDKLESRGVTITPISGLIRISRLKPRPLSG